MKENIKVSEFINEIEQETYQDCQDCGSSTKLTRLFRSEDKRINNEFGMQTVKGI